MESRSELLSDCLKHWGSSYGGSCWYLWDLATHFPVIAIINIVVYLPFIWTRARHRLSFRLLLMGLRSLFFCRIKCGYYITWPSCFGVYRTIPCWLGNVLRLIDYYMVLQAIWSLGLRKFISESIGESFSEWGPQNRRQSTYARSVRYLFRFVSDRDILVKRRWS